MTGGTLLVKNGNYYGMTKVAHEGMDLKNIDAMKTLVSNASTIDDIFVSYLRGRGGIDFEPWNVMDNDQVVECYIIDEYPNKQYPNDHWDFSDWGNVENLIDRMENDLNDECEKQELDDEHPWVQLGCSYCDYILAIDMDTSSAWLNGEEVW
jgi:hypothetical protein